tara:strand:+ start:454 stop:834 length:381 start_codon:yes stop_codon:yes gene_type:complete
MNNKIIGLVLSLISGFGAVAFGFFGEGAAGSFRYFISLPSFVFVIGVGGGLTFMRKHTINNEDLGKSLRSDFILAGWLGFLIGLILLLAGFSQEEINYFAGDLGAAIVTILYGYYMGAIAEAFMTK